DAIVSGAHATAAQTSARPQMSNATRVGVIAAIAAAIAVTVALPKLRSNGAGTPKVVAVLPFDNAGGDSAQQYFVDGMADDIRSALVNGGMSVAASASSNAFKGQ